MSAEQRSYILPVHSYINGGTDTTSDGDDFALQGNHSAASTSANQIPAIDNLTFFHTKVRFTTHSESQAGTDPVWSFVVDGSIDTALDVTIPTTTVGVFTNTTGRLQIAENQLLSYVITWGTQTSAMTLRCTGIQYEMNN